MDYFFMNDYIFKIILNKNKSFIINLLKEININITNYNLFELSIESNIKKDILLFTNNFVINIELNTNKKSILRNKIYIECLSKILSNYKLIQININTFSLKNETYNNIKIYNLYKTNEYINFITSKNPLTFQTKNKEINKIISQFKKININKIKNIIIKQELIKENIDDLIQE